MIARVLGLALAVWCGALATASAQATYQRYNKIVYPNDCQVSGESHSRPCCTVDGWDFTFDELHHPHCPTLYDVYSDVYSCTTDQKVSTGLTGPVAQRCCSCGGPDPSCGGGLNPDNFIDQAIKPGTTYQCDRNTSPTEPEQCDGLSNGLSSGSFPADKGCGSDEHSCSVGDSDPAPVRYSSGRVESIPITLFSVHSPDDVFFGYRIFYNSQTARTAAQRNTVTAIHDEHPVIHHSQEDTHYIGFGWLDNYSDRLQITAPNTPATQISWTSQSGTVTFFNSNGAWKSWTGKFELIDRGTAPADGFGRWVVRSIDPTAPRQIWAFEEIEYQPYDGGDRKRLGRLRRRAVLTSNLGDLVGRYGFTVTWTAEGLIASATDSLERTFEFDYQPEPECVMRDPNKLPPEDDCVKYENRSNRLVAVRYKPHGDAASTVVARLQPTAPPANDRLERVERPGLAGYTRFLYHRAPPMNSCVHCNALLTDVIVAGDAALSTPVALAPVLPTEVVLEHDDYGPSPSPGTLNAIHSSSPGREYAYEYSLTQTTQFDLNQDAGPCNAGNACPLPGQACRTVGQLVPHCYVADVIQHDLNTGLSTSHTAAGASPPGGTATGGTHAFARGYAANGVPRNTSGASGQRTTYGYDALNRLRCVVRGDNDTQAFADPTHPDTSSCAGPAGSQIVQIDFAATSVTTTTPSSLGGTVTDVDTLDPASLLPVARARTGATRDIDGTTHAETHTVTMGYDVLGRIALRNGPLDDNVAYDATATSYYTAYDPASPYDLGQVHQVTTYAGTVAANVPLTTTYAAYDLFGVPHRVTSPNGEQLVYAASSDRLQWTITQLGSDGAVVGTSTIVLNADGTVRSSSDPDGVCVTYEYADASGYVGVPTVIRRSNTACGQLPIDQNSDEVEIRTYVKGEPDRLQSIVRKTDGVVEFSYAGFTYDRDRRLIASTTLDAAQPFTFGFTDVLPTRMSGPGGAVAGSWKTELGADPFGRLATLSRFVDGTNKQTFGYGYASATAQRPTTLTRGFNGAATSVTTLVYDDFGRLIEARVPEAGPPGAAAATRYEYDVANRRVKERIGVGTADVNTTAFTYDAIDRLTVADHDLEHPIDCAAATTPAGTPIQDESYQYDGCAAPDAPSGFTCRNALGRLTISRVTVQCGTGHDAIARGRWYAYDDAGRVEAIAYAAVQGASIGPAATIQYTYSAASRLRSATSPLNAAFGTRYTYGPVDGRVATLETTAGSPIAAELSYQAFGAVTGFTTASTQTVADGTRALAIHNAYRSDAALDHLRRGFEGAGTTPLDLVDQAMAYTAAGQLGLRSDAADPASSRYYGYDALQRLLCEVRDGSSADCTTNAPRLATLFTYGNGQSATSPVDTRLSAYINVAGGYTSPSVETYVYAAGSGQVQTIQRSGGQFVLGYDHVGRRTFDYQADAAGQPGPGSRRDYAYLPNGQLGTIQGHTASGDAYTVTVRYDAEARPLLMSYVTSAGEVDYELFWDDGNRLVAASLSGATELRWHYHYLGNTLVAATRETVGETTSVKRFWIVSDERGLISRVVDEAGATHWQARWDATAWRSLVGTPQPDMWIPFGLPGQLLLDGTSAGTGASTRPEIAINHHRAMDPFTGGFLQPDPADQTTRLLPEGYLYGRGDYVESLDVTGADSKKRGPGPLDPLRKLVKPGWSGGVDESCSFVTVGKGTLKDTLLDRNLLDQIATDIDNCRYGKCGDEFAGPNLKRQWKFALLTGTYYCANDTIQVEVGGHTWSVDEAGSPYANGMPDAAAWTFMGVAAPLKDRQTLFGMVPKHDSCWAREIAHEALHGAIRSIPLSYIDKSVPKAGDLLFGPNTPETWQKKLGGTGDQVILGERGLEMCVNCKK